MTHPSTAAGALTPDITAALTPDSEITATDRVDAATQQLVWDIKIDGQTVATVPYDAELDAEHLVTTAGIRVKKLRKRAELVAGIRALADFLERHPDAPDPHVWGAVWSHLSGSDGFRTVLEALQTDGLDVDIRVEGELVKASHAFGPVKLEIEELAKKVCEQITTVKEVTEQVLPDWAQQVAA